MKTLIVYHTFSSGAAKTLECLKNDSSYTFCQFHKTRNLLNRNIILFPILIFRILFHKKILLNGLAIFANPHIHRLQWLLSGKKVYLYWHEANTQMEESLKFYSVSFDNFAKFVSSHINISDSKMVSRFIQKKFDLTDYPKVLEEAIDFPVFDRELRKPKEPLKIVAVGNLCKRKGIDTFLELVSDTSPSFDFHWIGRNVEFTAERQQKVQNILNSNRRIKIHGFINQPFEEIASATAFLLPSKEEPFGIVYLEALALGTFVIVSPSAGFADCLDGQIDIGYVYSSYEDLLHFIKNKLKNIPNNDEAIKKRIAFAKKFDFNGFRNKLKSILEHSDTSQ